MVNKKFLPKSVNNKRIEMAVKLESINFYCIFSRSYWRSLISIACNLHRTRELRGLFLELAEKLIEPWKQTNWELDQVKQFLPAVTQSVLELEISRDQETRCLWDRYMQVIGVCLVKMYHN